MKVKVGGLSYKIKLLSDTRLVGTNGNKGRQLLGETAYMRQELRIYTKGEPTLTEQTFYHELVHAIVNAHKIRDMQDDDDKHNEDNIDRMAMGLQEALSSMGIHLIDVLLPEKKGGKGAKKLSNR